MAEPARARPNLIPLAGVALLFAVAMLQAVAANNFQDFFIYRLGSVIALKGESPYDLDRVRSLIAAQYPDDDPKFDSFVNNCGYFGPPLALVLFAPFAAVPWPVAKVLWAVTTLFAAWGITKLPALFRPAGSEAWPPTLLWQVVPVLVVFNIMTISIVVVGQTTLVFVGAIAAGQWCFERGRPLLGAFAWSVVFIKPHVALPLIPLAWYLGGWRRAGLVVGVAGALNLIGAMVAGGTPMFLKTYLDYVPTAHASVLFNRAELNVQISSWNRLLMAYGGPVIELSIMTIAAGYLVWFGLVAGRCVVAREKPSAAWAAATAVCGMLLCCQLLGYELLLLTVTLPWVRELLAAGRRLRPVLAGGLMLVEYFVPLGVADRLGVEAYRPLGVALFAALVLSGPVNPLRRDAERSA